MPIITHESYRDDFIVCDGLHYECELGFHPYEQKVKQKITIRLKAFVKPLGRGDHVDSLQMDYFVANKMLSELFLDKKFNLLETVAEEVAMLILNHFLVQGIEVTVTKYPLDMLNVSSVSYVCYRQKT